MKYLGTNIEDLDIATRELVATQVGELSSEVATKADQTDLESAVDRVERLEGLSPVVTAILTSGTKIGTIKQGGSETDFYAPTQPSLDGYATRTWVTNQGYITDVVSALGYTPFDEDDFTTTNIKSTLGIYDWALASSKPSYKFSEITSKPDTLSGYGILADAESKFLSLSEGAIILAIAENALARDSFDRIYADAIDANTISAEMIYTNTINGNTPITSGNIGDQSVNYATSAGKATQLANSRTIWGRSFNGTGDISGAIEGATTGNFSSNVTIGGTLTVTGISTFTGNTTNKAIAYFAGGTNYYVNASGVAKFASLTTNAISGTSGTFSSTLKATGLLTASGGITIPTGESLTIGGAVLSWDSSASALKISSSVYSDGTVSALGAGEAGSGGGGGGSVTNINGSKILRCESLEEVITYLESESNDMGGYFIVNVSTDVNLGNDIANLTSVASLQSGVVIEFVKMNACNIAVPSFPTSGIRVIGTSFSSPTMTGGTINGSATITFSSLAGFRMVYNGSVWNINL